MSFRTVADIEQVLRSRRPSVRDLHAAWEQRVPIPDVSSGKKATGPAAPEQQVPWLQDIAIGRLLTRHAVEQEEFLLACDAAAEILRLPADANNTGERTRVQMDHAAALTRIGFTRKARETLEQIDTRSLGRNLKVDIALQLGDIAREESYQAPTRAEQRDADVRALDFYERALKEDPERLGAQVRIASTLFMLGEHAKELLDRSRNIARDLLAAITAAENESAPKFETSESRAIAHAVLGDPNAAMRSFEALQALEGVSTSQLAEARFRAQFLAEALGESRDLFRAAFPPLQLIVFSGHLPDQPGRRRRLPPESIAAARDVLRSELDSLQARVGLVSASAGADLLFIEALLSRQGTVHVVLPWEQEEFRRTSIQRFDAAGGSGEWENLFDRALREAATIRTIGQAYEPGSDAGWEYMMDVTAGIALQTARASRLDIQPMVLWDGQPGYGAGGTDSFYQLWLHRLHQKPINILPKIAPTGRAPDAGEASDAPAVRSRSERAILRQEVKSMLFADIVGYSKLSEKVIPEFIGTFLDRMSRLVATSNHAPCYVNTWGDAIYAVFDFAHDAGLFALELTRMLQAGEDDWLGKGLYWEEQVPGRDRPVRHALNIRVGLHTGPVFVHYDPVLRRVGFTGSHVSRAARIEPVTQPGEVFASEEFAAVAKLGSELERRNPETAAGSKPSGDDGFACEYTGSMPLAKGYPGRFRIYRVVPARAFGIEDLAKAAHQRYCREGLARGETPVTNSALRPWEELSEYWRDANRALVADIPNKLRLLGYELAPGHGISPLAMPITIDQIERQAIREHDRWMAERIRNGWTYAPERDNARKHHPCIVAWDQLSELEKDKDRETIRMLPGLIEQAGFRLRRLKVAGAGK